MTAPRTFRVFVYEWTSWDVVVTAKSEAAARRKAERMWEKEGPEAFNLHDSGVDEIEAMERAAATFEAEGGAL
jgi:hypothetical protein